MVGKIKYYNASELEMKLKCTIQKTGKLGFSDATIKKLNINENRGIKIGIEENDNKKSVLYMIIVENPDASAFKINKAGTYYYVNTKGLFDQLEYNYKEITIIFDITETVIEGEKIYKLIKREIKKKQK